MGTKEHVHGKRDVDNACGVCRKDIPVGVAAMIIYDGVGMIQLCQNCAKAVYKCFDEIRKENTNA